MEKILVTTDLSAKSKSAIQFAITLAKSRKAELIILHVYHLVRPFKWTDDEYSVYWVRFKNRTMRKLTAFTVELFGATGPGVPCQMVLHSNIDVVEGIMEYAEKHDCAYICISTRGAGRLKKLFGTHTSKLISHSTVPVLAVPSFYHLLEIKQVLYATDMTDYEKELEKVVAFARPIGAAVDMIHIAYPYEFQPAGEIITEFVKRKLNYPVNILEWERNITHTLLEDIDAAVKANKPSLLALFTHQSRPLLEKLLLPSNAKAYSFYSKVPLLTFSKTDGNK